MNLIPKKLREELSQDPYYKTCCITGHTAPSVKIEWHHNFIYAGRQVQRKWCILPLAEDVHRNIVFFKEKCDWIMFNQATNDELREFSKAVDLIKKRERLNKIYGDSILGTGKRREIVNGKRI